MQEFTYSVLAALVKQRRRGTTGSVKEDLLLAAAIRQRKSSAQVSLLRTEKQKKLFDEFKEGRYLAPTCLVPTLVSTRSIFVLGLLYCISLPAET